MPSFRRNTWCYYHMKEECLHFRSDLKCVRCAPLVWHGRCPGDTPIPAKPSEACLVWRSRLRCWWAVAILVLSLEVVGRKQCPWRKTHRKKSHTVRSGDRGGQVQKVLSVSAAVSHEGRTSNAFKVTMKLQTFIFQMVVTSCISIQYLWKYDFVKSSDNLYASCIMKGMCSLWHSSTDVCNHFKE